MTNLLMVDDDIYCTEGVKLAINWKEIGVDHIYTAQSMEQAIKILEAKWIDILISDIEMPKGSGFDLLRWVEGMKYKPVIIILTSHARFNYAKRAIEFQCLDYLLKPVSKEKLLEVGMRCVKKVRNNSKKSPEYDAECMSGKIAKYINEHIGSDLTRENIAAELFLSPDYMSRIFRQETGVQLSEYITNIRMEEAKELLTETSMPINEVAFQVGYSNIAYFSKVFRIKNSLTPAQYRNKIRER